MRFSLLISLILFCVNPSLLASQPLGKSIYSKTKVERPLSPKTKYGFNRTREIARLGSKSQRFEIRHGDCGAADGWSDCKNDRRRIERRASRKNTIEKPGRQVWYGWSMYLPANFRDISPANTTVGQVKLKNWREPLWMLNLRAGRLIASFSSDARTKECKMTSISKMRGKWTDITIFADYSPTPKGPTFVMYVNGKVTCSKSNPILTNEMLSKTSKELGLKYGIYNSYVSRWLSRNKTKPVQAKAFVDKHKDSGIALKSATSEPFAYDWGVQLPTQIIYYDEMRYGKSREQVDVRFIEASGGKPVD